MAKFIQKKIEVDEPNASMRFRSGQHVRKPFSLECQNIYLIGMRASGKTTLGKALAKELGCACVDTDSLLVRNSGQEINALVEAHGWEHFRRLEEEALRRASALPGKVIATGGGVVLSPNNRVLMNDTGVTFYLAGDAALLIGRMLREPLAAQRPPLTGLELHDEVAQLMTEREPLYMSCMDHMLQANRGLEELMDDVLVDLGLREWDFSERARIMDRY